MFRRPTTLAAAFVTAAAKNVKQGADAKKGTGDWITRRVVLIANGHGILGTVAEYDKRPEPPTKEEAQSLAKRLKDMYL